MKQDFLFRIMDPGNTNNGGNAGSSQPGGKDLNTGESTDESENDELDESDDTDTDEDTEMDDNDVDNEPEIDGNVADGTTEGESSDADDDDNSRGNARQN